jgi:hypothetical protein
VTYPLTYGGWYPSDTQVSCTVLHGPEGCPGYPFRAETPHTPTDANDPIPAEEDEVDTGAWMDERPDEPDYEPVPESVA